MPRAMGTLGEPICAVRTWNLAIIEGTPRLIPVGDERSSWPVLRPVRARCARRRRHAAPAPECTCGLHGSKGLALLRRTRGPAVLGTVALWGRTIEHELGYRAEFAYPQRLRLVCPVCFSQRGDAASQPTVAAIGRRGAVMPLCEEHVRTAEACGAVIRGHRHPRELHTDLLAEYRVDPLPA